MFRKTKFDPASSLNQCDASMKVNQISAASDADPSSGSGHREPIRIGQSLYNVTLLPNGSGPISLLCNIKHQHCVFWLPHLHPENLKVLHLFGCSFCQTWTSVGFHQIAHTCRMINFVLMGACYWRLFWSADSYSAPVCTHVLVMDHVSPFLRLIQQPPVADTEVVSV